MTNDTPRGIHVSEKQLVFVLTAGLVLCGVVFLFGVLVGRGVQSARGPVSDGTMVSAPQAVSDLQPAAEAAATNPVTTSGEALSYPKRLSQPDGPAEQLKTPPVAANASSDVGKPGAGLAGSPPPAPAGPPPDLPDESVGIDSSNKTTAASTGGKPAAALPGKDASAGPWFVQVIATKKRSEADAILKRLKVKGYPAYVFVPDSSDRTGGFRVRVGTYPSRSAADLVARRLGTEGFKNLWVTH